MYIIKLNNPPTTLEYVEFFLDKTLFNIFRDSKVIESREHIAKLCSTNFVLYFLKLDFPLDRLTDQSQSYPKVQNFCHLMNMEW